MSLAYYIKREELAQDERVARLFERLSGVGLELYPADCAAQIRPHTKALLSIGGDGTFLTAAQIAVQADIPILGVDFGRLGFLTGAGPEELPHCLNSLHIDPRVLLSARCSTGLPDGFWPFAFNEMSVSRVSASMLGVDVSIDGKALPTYWADGLLVATSSGSTAYSLSVGGPICTPDTELFIIAPISPHNLNLRPLVIPQNSHLVITLRSRDAHAIFSADNRACEIPSGSSIEIELAPMRMRRLTSDKSNFIDALKTKLLWGVDLRNGQNIK